MCLGGRPDSDWRLTWTNRMKTDTMFGREGLQVESLAPGMFSILEVTAQGKVSLLIRDTKSVNCSAMQVAGSSV